MLNAVVAAANVAVLGPGREPITIAVIARGTGDRG